MNLKNVRLRRAIRDQAEAAMQEKIRGWRDGTYTYVISRNDPGVHNWIDPCDMDEGMLTLRMAEFPGKRPQDDLSAKGTVVKVNELKGHLPEGTTWVTPAERAKQQADRAAAYKRRLPEVNE